MDKHNEQTPKDSASTPEARASGIAVQTRPSLEIPEQRKQPYMPLSTQRIRRRQLLVGGLAVAATVAGVGRWLYAESPHPAPPPPRSVNKPKQQSGDQLVIQWNNVILQTLRLLQPSLPVAARALAIVHTSMFDAWAAYDRVAVGTQLGAHVRQAQTNHTAADQAKAISYAAYRALVDLFPSEKKRFQQMMTSLKYDPADQTTHANTPAGMGNLAAQAVLDFRHTDGSNQLGTLAPGAYGDYTHYSPVNTPTDIINPNHWQPLLIPNAKPAAPSTTQQFSAAQWGDVQPFALASAAALIPVPGPPRLPSAAYIDQARQILQDSASLTDEQKVIAEYWMADSQQEQLPSRWNSFAQMIALRAHYTLAQNITLFFTLTNALFDASIACWATKRAYSSPYPLTAIHYLFNGKQVRAWGGPSRGVQTINGADWQPYRPKTLPAPTYPEYCSEQSVFSAAAAEILRRFTGSDHMGFSATQLAHHSHIEPHMPATTITLSWSTFTQAADQAGVAGRYSGTHFAQSDLDGRTMGRAVGTQVWAKAQAYITGKAPQKK